MLWTGIYNYFMLKATWKKQKDNSDVAEKETLFNKVAVL
jgi:hypothetical protein